MLTGRRSIRTTRLQTPSSDFLVPLTLALSIPAAFHSGLHSIEWGKTGKKSPKIGMEGTFG